MKGRHAKLKSYTYVLTAAEVSRLYFRKGAGYVERIEFKLANPSFPLPRADGLYHRAAVEAWVDSTFSLKTKTPRKVDATSLIASRVQEMVAQAHGRGQN